MPTAVITGASAGLGRALATALAERGWNLVLDARRPDRLLRLAGELGRSRRLHAIPGDVGDAEHRRELASAAAGFGSLDLLVNNASTLGPSPLPPLAELTAEQLAAILHTNVVAPLALIQLTLPALAASGGTVVNVSSDARGGPLPGLGRLRLRKSCAGPSERHAGRGAPAAALVQLRPGRHAHRDAPGGLPR
jgi:NAD(P)-dependent dehydrogenase (short-subunit alcohol dehydrogenase family)